MTFKIVRNLFIFAVVLIFLKAFYFDKWYEANYGDSNSSQDENITQEVVNSGTNDEFSQRGKGIETVSPEDAMAKNEGNISGMKSENTKTGMNDKEKMPIDKLGDSIANTLKGKISN
jgi:hypothetical protein